MRLLLTDNAASAHRQRLHHVSDGNRRQLLNMITYALGVNALSMHVRRQGLATPQAA